jgi:hypothetical protein
LFFCYHTLQTFLESLVCTVKIWQLEYLLCLLCCYKCTCLLSVMLCCNWMSQKWLLPGQTHLWWMEKNCCVFYVHVLVIFH